MRVCSDRVDWRTALDSHGGFCSKIREESSWWNFLTLALRKEESIMRSDPGDGFYTSGVRFGISVKAMKDNELSTLAQERPEVRSPIVRP